MKGDEGVGSLFAVVLVGFSIVAREAEEPKVGGFSEASLRLKVAAELSLAIQCQVNRSILISDHMSGLTMKHRFRKNYT